MSSDFALVEDRPRLCLTCGDRAPARRHTIYDWICYVCLQRYQYGRDAAAMAVASRGRAVASELPKLLAPELPEPVASELVAPELPELVAPELPELVASELVAPELPELVASELVAPEADEPCAEPVAPSMPELVAPCRWLVAPSLPEMVAPELPPARPAPTLPAPTLRDQIRDAMIADPDLSSYELAARIGAISSSVRRAIRALRKRGLLPPALPELVEPELVAPSMPEPVAPELPTLPAPLPRRLLPPAPPRPLFSPTTIRGRLLALITEQPGIGGKRAAMLLGTAQSCVFDALFHLRKRGLIAPFDLDRHGCYPLPSTPPQEPLIPDPTPATMRDVVVAIAEALGIDDPEQATEEDILQAAKHQSETVTHLIDEKRRMKENLEINLQAAKHQTETVTHLIDEKRRMKENLEINRGLLSSVEAHVSWLTGEMDRLRSELAARPVPIVRTALTREELKARIDDLNSADEVEEEAEELRLAAETGRRAAFGLEDLDADDLRALADLRLARSRKLHQRALGGR